MPYTPTDPSRDIPIRRGHVYCAPSCGFKCSTKAHDRAEKEANALALKMGSGWEPRIWENCGWNYEVTNGIAELYPSRDGSGISGSWKVTGYTCYLRGNVNVHAKAKTAEDALGFAMQDARTNIRRATSELNELSN